MANATSLKPNPELSLADAEAERLRVAEDTWTFGQTGFALLEFISSVTGRPDRALGPYQHYVLESLLIILSRSIERCVIAGMPSETFEGIEDACNRLKLHMSKQGQASHSSERFELLRLEIMLITSGPPN